MLKNTIITLIILSSFSNCNQKVEKRENTEVKNSMAYICNEGKKLSISYLETKEDSRSILLQLKDKHYKLKRVRSASGEKYSDGKYTWWSKDSSGFLEIDDVIIMKNCVFQTLPKI